MTYQTQNLDISCSCLWSLGSGLSKLPNKAKFLCSTAACGQATLGCDPFLQNKANLNKYFTYNDLVTHRQKNKIEHPVPTEGGREIRHSLVYLCLPKGYGGQSHFPSVALCTPCPLRDLWQEMQNKTKSDCPEHEKKQNEANFLSV